MTNSDNQVLISTINQVHERGDSRLSVQLDHINNETERIDKHPMTSGSKRTLVKINNIKGTTPTKFDNDIVSYSENNQAVQTKTSVNGDGDIMFPVMHDENSLDILQAYDG